MRVRTTAPTWDDIEATHGDPLEVLALLYLQTRAEIIRWYLSKVGTFRTESMFPYRLSALMNDPSGKWKASPTEAVQRAFWEEAYERIEGAPEWLREAFIEHWTKILKDWTDFGVSHHVMKAQLGGYLEYEQDPEDLP